MALIQLSLHRGDVDAAYKMATETQRLDPTNKTARLLIAAANLRKGNFSECRAQLDQLLQDSPRSVDVLLEMGVLDLMQKRYPEAEQAYRSAFERMFEKLRSMLTRRINRLRETGECRVNYIPQT